MLINFGYLILFMFLLKIPLFQLLESGDFLSSPANCLYCPHIKYLIVIKIRTANPTKMRPEILLPPHADKQARTFRARFPAIGKNPLPEMFLK
jgi:hypothetical protein